MDDKKMDELAKEERLNYFREWRRKNADKVKAHNQNYWLKRAQKKLQEVEDDTDKSTKNADHS